MSERKLFWAKDSEGVRYFIDKLDDAIRSKDFFCPLCGEPVYPRMGEHNVWHFAHKGEVCNHLKKTHSSGHDLTLNKFADDYVDIDNFEFSEDDRKFCCPLCKSVGAKEHAIQWNEKVFICKRCFQDATPEEIMKLDI